MRSFHFSPLQHLLRGRVNLTVTREQGMELRLSRFPSKDCFRKQKVGSLHCTSKAESRKLGLAQGVSAKGKTASRSESPKATNSSTCGCLALGVLCRRKKRLLGRKKGPGETKQGAPDCSLSHRLRSSGPVPAPCPAWASRTSGLPRTNRTPGLGLLGAPQGTFLLLLLKHRALVRITVPQKTFQEKAIHLHRPDLGCSDVQEKGEKEEQEQDPKHLP